MRKTIDLASAMGAVSEQPARELSLAELVRAFSIARCDASDTRLRKWLQAFGEKSAWAITSEQLECAAQAMLDHGYKPASVNRDLSALGGAYRWAKERRISPRGFRSPTLDIRRQAEGIRRVHVEPEKLQRLRALSLAWPDRRFGVYVALLLDSGARKSEILERQWKDFDIERREVLAPTTKNGTPRVLFFSQQTADLIARVFPQRDPDGLPFQGKVPGQPISYRKAWLSIVAEAGIEELRQHDLRHVAAASMLRSGTTLPVAAQVLGHDPAVLARRYGHLETAALKRAQEQAWQHSNT